MPDVTEIRLLQAQRLLLVSFDDNTMAELPAEYLRVESPSAEVQGHSPAERQIVGGKRLVGIRAVEPVGNYAVRLMFDDGHDTGIFSWELLYRLGRERTQRWQAYLQGLERAGLSR